MLIYAAQRIALAVLICITAMTMLFGATRAIPGDLATIMLGPRATPERVERLNREMGLDKPLPAQLALFLGSAVQGDLGTDPVTDRKVVSVIMDVLPNTLALIACGLGWAAAIGIPLGCYSAVRRNTFIDKFTGVISVGTISMPSFVVGIYAALIFAVQLNWLPMIGAGEPGDVGDQIAHLVMPSFAVGLGWVGYLARIVRASMLEVMGENHIRTARAFGIPESKVVSRYALRIAILPTVTLLALAIGGLLSSTVFAEKIFARPGIGSLIVDSTYVRNYPMVQGAVLITVGLFIAATIITDLVVAWLDPRVRTSI
ncbi:MAG: ABC transporter permease [Dongiaceae bacterium]